MITQSVAIWSNREAPSIHISGAIMAISMKRTTVISFRAFSYLSVNSSVAEAGIRVLDSFIIYFPVYGPIKIGLGEMV